MVVQTTVCASIILIQPAVSELFIVCHIDVLGNSGFKGGLDRFGVSNTTYSYTNQVTIEYRVPLVTGIISWGYIKFEGNIRHEPFSSVYINPRSKNAKSPPS